MNIGRSVDHPSVVISSGADVSGRFNLETKAGALLIVASGYSSNLTLTFEVADLSESEIAEGGSPTWYPLCDSSGSAVSLTMVAGRAYQLPDAVNFSGVIRLKIGANATQNETFSLITKG